MFINFNQSSLAWWLVHKLAGPLCSNCKQNIIEFFRVCSFIVYLPVLRADIATGIDDNLCFKQYFTKTMLVIIFQQKSKLIVLCHKFYQIKFESDPCDIWTMTPWHINWKQLIHILSENSLSTKNCATISF